MFKIFKKSGDRKDVTKRKGATIGQKIIGIVGLCIGLLIVVAVIGIVQMQRIGVEITEIAEQDLPLIEIISAITVHQLEQAVNFERTLRYGEEMEHSERAAGHFIDAKAIFEELAHKVDAEILVGEELAAVALAHATTEESRVEFEHILSSLKTIEKEHADYDKHATHVIELMAEGEVEEAIESAEAVEIEEEQLDHELEALLEEIEKFTEHSALAAEEHEKFGIMLMIIVSTIASIGGFLLTVWIVRRTVTGPLSQITSAMRQLADGDKSFTVEHADRTDEIGDLAKALATFKDNAVEKDRIEAEQAEEQTKREARAESVDRLTKDFDSAVAESLSTVTSAAAEMQTTAEAMASTAEATSRQSQAAAAASEQASTNVQTVSAASEEMSSSINEIARQVAHSATLAKTAVEEAKKSNESVQGLAESSQKIGEVVDIISDIASQTNLLALNATIEAARAGDAGKGFAVVASEVKSLATQTAKATDEIAAQIAAIQAATDESVGAIKGIGEKIAEMDEVTTTIASAIEEQGTATGEISNNSQQAALGTQEVSENVAKVNQAATETGTAAGQVLQTAGELSKQAKSLRAEVDKFLAEVRAA